jgi:hypothetical protein
MTQPAIIQYVTQELLTLSCTVVKREPLPAVPAAVSVAAAAVAVSAAALSAPAAVAAAVSPAAVAGRALHWSNYQLNLICH